MNTCTNWTETIPGYRTKTIKRGKVTLVVHRPILTDKERTKREGAVENALAHFARHERSESR